MKFFGVIVLLSVAASSQAQPDARSKRSTINENLVTMVEGFQETMKTGSEDLGIPILDPYTQESLILDVEESIATLDGSFTDLTVSGLSGFSIDTLTFSLVGVKFTYAFTFPSINVSSKYNIDGLVASTVPIYGDGAVNVTVENFTISGVIGLSVNNSYLYVRTIETTVSVGEFSFDGTGILNNDDVSALVSAVVTDVVPGMIVDYQTPITGLINTFVTEMANNYLGTMTLSELLALIRG